MKSIVFTAILLLALGSAWSLYLHHGNRKFEENLPKLPKTDTLTDTGDAVTPTDEGYTNEGYTTFQPPNTMNSSATEDEYTDTQTDSEVTSLSESVSELEFSETSELDETDFFDFPEIPQKPQGVSLRDWLSRLSTEELEAVYAEKPWLKPVSEMTYEEKVAEVNRRQQQFVDLFGNLPEIAVFNKYVTVEALMGEPQIIAPEDIVMHAKALSIITPTPENIRHYKKMKAGEESEWHIAPDEH